MENAETVSWNDEDGTHQQYDADKIPEDITIPVDDVGVERTPRKRKQRNADFDESQTYISREERDEWNVVGLMGQVPITKGQPIASNWIKMNDVSATVEMYFIK